MINYLYDTHGMLHAVARNNTTDLGTVSTHRILKQAGFRRAIEDNMDMFVCSVPL